MKSFLLIFMLLSIQSMAQQSNSVGKLKFLALGDSYTIGESVAVEERWPVQLAKALRKRGIDCSDPTIIATTGWRTDDLKNALENILW
jgi:lysophospholipase L1-like esterase